MARFGNKEAIQSRLAPGWVLLILDLVVIGVLAIIWLNRGIDAVAGSVTIGILAALGIFVGVFVVRRVSRSLTHRLETAVNDLGTTVAELMAISSQVAAGAAGRFQRWPPHLKAAPTGCRATPHGISPLP